MPITIIYYAIMFLACIVIISNIAIPLICPRYKFLWMFTDDKYSEAINKMEEAQRNESIKDVKEISKKINQKRKDKKNGHLS